MHTAPLAELALHAAGAAQQQKQKQEAAKTQEWLGHHKLVTKLMNMAYCCKTNKLVGKLVGMLQKVKDRLKTHKENRA